MNAIQNIARQMSRLLVVAGVSIAAFAAIPPPTPPASTIPSPPASPALEHGYGPMVLKQSGCCVMRLPTPPTAAPSAAR